MEERRGWQAERLVNRMPLEELWDASRTVQAERKRRSISPDDIRELLRSGPVRFVVANVGHPLRWIGRDDCYQFWKDELRSRVCIEPVYLEDYPGEHCYFASEWQLESGEMVILLEMAH